MNVVYFEDFGYERLLPLTWLRTAGELRCGRDCLIDKIRARCGARIVRLLARPALQPVLAERIKCDLPDGRAGWCLLNTRALATARLELPQAGIAWRSDGELIAAGIPADRLEGLSLETFLSHEHLDAWTKGLRFEEPPEAIQLIRYPWDLILANAEELVRQCRDGGVHKGQVYPGAHLVRPQQVHVAAGARIKPGAVLDADDGPIHIDADALVQPNAVIEGPCYIGSRSVVRPGAAIRPGTSIGPVCKVGGEIEGSILQGYSNKQHDGFLGHSFVAPWVNIGADTVTSDLKNTYGTIRVYINGRGVESGQHFIGSIIGDHSKTGIGTILPTGCVIGIAANVFTHRAAARFVPSFAWLTDEGMTSYRLEKAIQLARTVMHRRDVYLSDEEVRLFEHIAHAARDVESAGWS